MCDLKDIRAWAYELLKKRLTELGVGVVAVFFCVWQQHQHYQQSARYLETIRDVTKFTSEQTEVVRYQTKVLEQLSYKIERQYR